MTTQFNMRPRQPVSLVWEEDIKICGYREAIPFHVSALRVYAYPDNEIERVMLGDTDITNEVDIDAILERME